MVEFTFHYWLKNSEGKVVDSSEGGEPLVLQQGSKKIVPGLETAMLQKQAPAKFDVLVSADQGYGRLDPKLVQRLPVSAFDGIEHVEVGMMFQSGSGQDSDVVRVVHVDDKGVIVDANHPLAGMELFFEVELLKKQAL